MTDSKRAKKAPSKKPSTASKTKKKPMKAPGINPCTKLPHTDRWRKGLV